MYLQNRQTFDIFSLLDRHFVLCSHNLDMRKGSYNCRLNYLYLNYPQINKTRKSNHMSQYKRNTC